MEFVFIILLILLNGVFSMSEIALVTSKKIRLEAAMKAGKKGAKTALDLSLAPTSFLSTVQIGITLIGLLTGIYSGETITNNLEAWLTQFEALRPVADGLSVIIILLIITFFSLVLGELVPKRIAMSNPEGISRRVAPFMRFISIIALPFVWILTQTSDGIIKILNIKTKKSNITEEEIVSIIQEETAGGEIQTIERDIVERVFILGDRKIASLMTTRTDLVFINIHDDQRSVVSTIERNLHSIYPVYEKHKDNIIGVVLLKEMFTAIAAGNFNLKNHLKPAHFLTETTSAYNALEKFKISKMHYAMVTNEYGLVLGIVTMDDILTALVGDVSESNPKQHQLQRNSDGTWIVDGEYPIVEFEMRFNLLPAGQTEGINTIAGLILEELKHIPVVGEKMHWNGFEFEVKDMDSVKIEKVLVRRL